MDKPINTLEQQTTVKEEEESLKFTTMNTTKWPVNNWRKTYNTSQLLLLWMLIHGSTSEKKFSNTKLPIGINLIMQSFLLVSRKLKEVSRLIGSSETHGDLIGEIKDMESWPMELTETIQEYASTLPTLLPD